MGYVRVREKHEKLCICRTIALDRGEDCLRYQAIYSASGFIWYEQENSLRCLSLTKEAHF